MDRRGFALIVALAAACGKDGGKPHRERSARAPAEWPAVDELPRGRVRWLVDLPARDVPDLVAHRPVYVRDRVIVSGSRIGYVALDMATGAIAWQRMASDLGNPIFVGQELVLVHACEGDVAAAVGQRVIACFDRVDAADISARREGAITVPVDDPCEPSPGGWEVMLGDPEHLTITHGYCSVGVEYPSGRARSAWWKPSWIAPGGQGEVVWRDYTSVWYRVTHDGKSFVHDGGRWHLPGLTVLDAAHLEAVVRLDTSLRHDYVFSADHGGWAWPLPPPPDVRSTPAAIGGHLDTVFVLFDGNRVAALTAP